MAATGAAATAGDATAARALALVTSVGARTALGDDGTRVGASEETGGSHGAGDIFCMVGLGRVGARSSETEAAEACVEATEVAGIDGGTDGCTLGSSFCSVA